MGLLKGLFKKSDKSSVDTRPVLVTHGALCVLSHLLRGCQLMGLFGDSASPFDEIVEKVTGENLTSENWAMILDICDKINSDQRAPKLALLAIRKRLNHRDPHVVMLALSVLDSCWGNCGPLFRKEVSSASFISELSSKATCSIRPVAEKSRQMVKKWAETECKADPSLSLIFTMYKNLVADGYSFDSAEPKKKIVISNDPNVVHSQEEEDAIAKAIALSLQDEKQGKRSQLYPSSNGNGFSSSSNAGGGYSNSTSASNAASMYPSISSTTNNNNNNTKPIPKKVHFNCDNSPPSVSPVPSSITVFPSETNNLSRNVSDRVSMSASTNNNSSVKQGSESRLPERTVRALYDFEAAEDNELSFVTGDLITVTDDSNPNWWRGRIGVQQGLFPSSFVTSDLSEVKPEPSGGSSEPRGAVAVVDEATLLRCIQLLEECDPTGETPDAPELAQTETASMAQAPLINSRLTAIDRQSNALAQVDIAIRDVLALYDQAVQQTNPYQNMYSQQQQPGGQGQGGQSMAPPTGYQQNYTGQQSMMQHQQPQPYVPQQFPPQAQPQQYGAPMPPQSQQNHQSYAPSPPTQPHQQGSQQPQYNGYPQQQQQGQQQQQYGAAEWAAAQSLSQQHLQHTQHPPQDWAAAQPQAQQF